MNDESEFQNGESVPSAAQSDLGSSSAAPTPVESTRPIPPYQQPAPERATAPARRGVVSAGLLAGALLVGGAAGVGGAAWYDAWQGDSSSTTSASTAIDTGSGTTAVSAAANGSIEQVASKVLPSVVKINVTGQSESGSGSGIILNAAGDILTNNHVAAVAGKTGSITVNFNNGDTAKATVVGTDPVTDLAVVKVSGVSGLTPATFGKSSSLKVGQTVVAVGSPYGLNSTVTSGIVSALNRPVSVQETDGQDQDENPFGYNPFGGQGQQEQQQQQQSSQSTSTTYPAIQTDAAINPGNSGGALVNLSGQVVGINSSIYSTTSSSSEAGSIGLGFAIPIDEAMPIVKQILAGETPTHARMGVTVQDLSGSSLQQGAKVHSVESGAAAAKAGFKAGDVITKVGDQVIDGADSLVATIRGQRPGQKVTITYIRDNQTKTVQVTLGSDASSKNS
jgi:putative serine protease PepD